MTRLSHSALEKYKGCPAQYKLHYIDRVRSHKLGSALIFGSAIDEALNRLLQTKMDEVPDGATDDLEALNKGFDHYFTYQKINKEMEDVKTSHFIEYFGSDFDADILELSDLESLSKFIDNAGYEETDPIKLYKIVSGNIKDKQEIPSTDQSYYNYASWLSLRRKGHMLIKHYKEEIMPQIKRVVSIQRAVNLPNESGDTLIGFVDLEAELEGHEGVLTLDNKTSSRNYKVADINDKGQLLIYDEYTKNGKAGYIVLLKKIAYDKKKTCQECGHVTSRAVKTCPADSKIAVLMSNPPKAKRCGGALEVEKIPYIKSQILVDDIDQEKKDLHFEVICDILEDIENKVFPENRDSCFQFGRKCVYYDLCRSDKKNPDYTGLSKA